MVVKFDIPFLVFYLLFRAVATTELIFFLFQHYIVDGLNDGGDEGGALAVRTVNLQQQEIDIP